MEDFVTWVDTSKLKRTIMSYNDEVGLLIIESCLLFTPLSLARRLRFAVSFRVRPTVILLYTAYVPAASKVIYSRPTAVAIYRVIHASSPLNQDGI